MFRKILFALMVLTLGTSHIKLTEYSKEYMPDMYDFADTGFKKISDLRCCHLYI